MVEFCIRVLYERVIESVLLVHGLQRCFCLFDFSCREYHGYWMLDFIQPITQIN